MQPIDVGMICSSNYEQSVQNEQAPHRAEAICFGLYLAKHRLLIREEPASERSDNSRWLCGMFKQTDQLKNRQASLQTYL